MNKQSNRSRQSAFPTLESLETRNLLSGTNTVTANLASGILQINSTGPADTVVIQQISKNVYVFSGNTSVGNFNPASINKIVVNLGAGNDVLDNKLTQPIPMEVFCGAGNDTVWGGMGNDTLHGGSGNDTMVERGGNNLIMGGTGNNVLFGGTGNDTIKGGTGNDILVAGTGNQLLQAGKGQDTLWGGSGNDTLRGGTGNDALYAGKGNNILYGGTGNDTLVAGPGNDQLYAGTGNDLLQATNGNATLVGGAGSDTLMGGSGTDTLTGGSGTTYIYGGSGTEVLKAGTGKTVMVGGSGNDTLIASTGTDQVWGGTGNNVFIGGPHATYFAGGPKANQFQPVIGYDNTFSVPFGNGTPSVFDPSQPFGAGVNVNQIKQGDVAGTSTLIQALKVNPSSFVNRIKYDGGCNYEVKLYVHGVLQWVPVQFAGNWSSHDAQPMDTNGNTISAFWTVIVQRAYLQVCGVNWTLPPNQWTQGNWSSLSTVNAVLYGPGVKSAPGRLY